MHIHFRTIPAFSIFALAVGCIPNAPDEAAVSAATSPEAAVHQLAQGCYSIQSPRTGKFLRKARGLLVRNEVRYRFDNVPANEAARFFFKPTALGEYLLMDQTGTFLGSRVPMVRVAINEPAKATEWRVRAERANNEFHFNFKSRLHATKIQFNYRFFRWESNFRLVPQQGCRAYPEMPVAVWPAGQSGAGDFSGNYNRMADSLRVANGQPLRGYVDAHSHLTAYEFMGGTAMHGAPFHRYGVEHALGDCRKRHGKNGRLDLIGGKQHDTAGWPSFTDWPRYNMTTHAGYYYKWIERAYLSGMRMMVVYLVENQVLCNIQNTINPITFPAQKNSCNTQESLFLQIERVHEMQDYIDAQFGGPGRGFFRVVDTPEEARSVMEQGKMAIVLGVEASEVLNCGERDRCNRNTIDTQLDALYNAGVRVMFPVHKFDNHFGGTRPEDGLVHVGQRISTGNYFQTENCDEHIHDYGGDYVRGNQMTAGFPLLDGLTGNFLIDLINDLGPSPDYPEGIEQCNQIGLRDLGVYLVNRMIDKKMIIDLDHLSPRAAATVMDIVEARNYNGVVSSHSWMRKGKDGPADDDSGNDPLHVNFNRMVAAGGFTAPYNNESPRMMKDVEQHLLAHMASYPRSPEQANMSDMELLQSLAPTEVPGVGLGIDMAGLGSMARPTPRKFEYPFVTEFGHRFEQQVLPGGRSFDIKDGMSHYGLVADHVEQMRQASAQAGKSYVYDAIMNSAEGYLTMWETAERRSVTSQHYEP